MLNRPDLLEQCVASIDEPVHLVVVDNSVGHFAVDVVADHFAGDYTIAEPPANLGVAASWNHIIRTHPADPFWLIANADTEFGRGDLARLIAEMELGGPRWVGMNGDWRVFGLSAEAIDQAGFFDENFHPIYAEDADYEYRCRLAGVPWYFIDGGATHVGSVSWRSDEHNAQNNARTYPDNVEYYARKWGGYLRGGEIYETPFNSGSEVRSWALDRRRLAANEWFRAETLTGASA